MDKFQNLRQNYPVFEYNSYEIKYNEGNIEVVYNFNVPGLTQFHPSWEFPYNKERLNDKNKKIFESVIFNLGMVEVISYLKATCSPKLIIKAGFLNNKQIDWFKKLYINGLGEFFYVNDLVSEMNVDTFLDIEIEGKEEEKYINTKLDLIGNLIPVGGGKDSALTLEVLNSYKEKNTCYIVNPRGASYECSVIAGYKENNIYCPKRCLDRKIIELNNQGFLNGHTPFSAILAFSSYASAILLGKKYIILSNEDSANESNVEGTNINHQYSKSIEFENDFRNYANTYLCKNGPEYFSLLRPISEWQIVKGFIKSPKYFSIFKSCNVGSKTDVWCESCPKCLYVYIMLAAFLNEQDMNIIFKTNMLDNIELENIFNGLVYPNYNKPFECVGTKEEVRLSLDMIVARYKKENKKLPRLLEKYNNLDDKNLDDKVYRMSKNWNDINNLPKEFAKLLEIYLK